MRPKWLVVGALSPVAAMALCLAVIAVVAPPNTWDSMTFHLSRVAHWISDGSLSYYPTENLRQLYESPWAEYAILNLQLLAGNDRLANLVQLSSMVGSVTGVSLIAQQLGAPVRGQVLTAIVVATLPMGILQATSTQTDYVVAFWIVCCVVFAFDLISQVTLRSALWFSSSLGLRC